MTKPILYLHMGVHRTATTSIQAYLKKNKESFIKNNILIPFDSGRQHPRVLKICHKKTPSKEIASQIIDEMESLNSNVNKVIFSDEYICRAHNQMNRAKLFEGFKEYFDVKIICSLRRQDTWLESWFLQNIKWQWDQELAHISFSDFFKKAQEEEGFPWIDYSVLTDAWANVFGEENLSLNVFEREYMPKGPIHTFLKSVEAEHLYASDKNIHANESFHPSTAEFLRHLGLDTLKDEGKQSILDCLPKYGKSSTILPAELQKEILDRYAKSNEYVARKYFSRDQLFSTEIKTNYIPWKELQSEEALSLMRDIVNPLVLAMAENMQALKQKR